MISPGNTYPVNLACTFLTKVSSLFKTFFTADLIAIPKKHNPFKFGILNPPFTDSLGSTCNGFVLLPQRAYKIAVFFSTSTYSKKSGLKSGLFGKFGKI
jgi:hypothetical protein